MPDTVRLGALQADLKDLELPMGLVIDSARLTGADLTLTPEPFSVAMPGEGRIVVTVGEKRLADFLEREAPGGLRGFHITAADGKLFVEASVRILIADVPANAVCTLRIDGGKRLYVDLESVDVAGVGAANLVESQLAKVNPVLDIDQFPLPLQITLETVTIAHGAVVLEGTARP